METIEASIINFRDRLFNAKEKSGLGFFAFSRGTPSTRTGVYLRGQCLFIGTFEEACKYVFKAAEMEWTSEDEEAAKEEAK